MKFVLRNLPYNVSGGRKDADSHYDVFTPESLADAVAFRKRVLGSEDRSDLFCSAQQFYQL